jgi:hypothetical protein
VLNINIVLLIESIDAKSIEHLLGGMFDKGGPDAAVLKANPVPSEIMLQPEAGQQTLEPPAKIPLILLILQ